METDNFINKIKLLIFVFVVTLVITGVSVAGASFSETEQEVDELFELIENNFGDEESNKQLEALVAENEIEIVGFTNLEKGRIDPQSMGEISQLSQPHLLVYFVRPGDSLYQIAREFNTTVDRLRTENNLDSDLLYVGDKLYIPIPDLEEDKLPDQNGSLLLYEVERGDSLYLIAREYRVTVDSIREENNLESDMLYVGQELYIPLPPENGSYADNQSPGTYTVQHGDSLYLIARQFDITINELEEMNNLDTDIIYPGQELRVPGGREEELVLSYEVEEGDTVYSLAHNFDLEAELIRDFNQLTDNHPRPGREIRLPFPVEGEMRNFNLEPNEREMNLLARAVYSEARGEPFKGQVAVAAVVLNRVQSDYFPDNIEDVIFQPWQFTAVHDGQFWLEPNQQSYVAARAALEGWDPTRQAIYYYNPETAESEWVFYRNVVIRIGQHLFAV